MFSSKTPKIAYIAKRYNELYPNRIKQVEEIFDRPSIIYIDMANVLPWQIFMKWDIDWKRLYQFLKSFDTVREIKIYCGTLVWDGISETRVRELKDIGYAVRTKPVKIMQRSIDMTSISMQDPAIIKQFIYTPLFRSLRIVDIEYLNHCMSELNKQWITKLEDRKCNFDVEIGTDMIMDTHGNPSIWCMLWSGDSDFHDILSQIVSTGYKATIFATTRRVSRELSELAGNWVSIYEIKKIKNFICKNKYIDPDFTGF